MATATDVTTYQFTLSEVSPLLQHADNIDLADELAAWRKRSENKKLSRAGDDRSPAWSWIAGLNHDGDVIALPTDYLRKCLTQAGSRITLKGSRTFKEEATSGLRISPLEYLPLLVSGNRVPVAPILALWGKEPEFVGHIAAAEELGFGLFVKRVGVNGKKHIRVRAKFVGWSVRGTIEVESEALKPDVLAELFDIAGRIGLGSWRPGGKTPGVYGMFESQLKLQK